MGMVAALGAGPARPAAACPGGEVKSFAELAERLKDYDEVTVLGAELLVSPTRACRETWVVEILTAEDEVRALLLDARTLEVRIVGHDGPTEAEDDDDFRIAYMHLEGRATSDLIEGEWSDDEMRGGPGADIFVVTPGSDVILDFEPGRDLLDLTHFADPAEGFGTLRSMADLTEASRLVRREGRPGVQIDIDGAAGDWSVTLLGLTPGELTRADVILGTGAGRSAPVSPTHWPERRAEFTDGTVVLFDAYPVDAPPPEGELIEGDREVLDMVRDILLGIFEDRTRPDHGAGE
jgi:hypothetical protein